MKLRKWGGIQVWVTPKQVQILKKAEELHPYKKRSDILKEALADYAEKYDIEWQDIEATA